MKLKQGWLLLVVLAVAIALLPVSPMFTLEALAATTADVTVNATPAYIAITNAPATYNFGVVQTSTNYSAPQNTFTITNTSTVTTNITIGTNGNDWTGGVGWTHSDTATAGADTAGLTSSNNTGAYDVIVKKSAAYNKLATDLPALTNTGWELKLVAPSSFTDGAEKSVAVRLTASAS
jgi:hypothetical protein